MRKYTPPSEVLVGNPEFLATMNFVESALYPVTDPSVARPVGTVSDINYRTVYETVFFGNGQIPGLYSQDSSPSPENNTVEDLSESITRWLSEQFDDAVARQERGSEMVTKAAETIFQTGAGIFDKSAETLNEAFAEAGRATPGAFSKAMRAGYNVLVEEFNIPPDSVGSFFSSIGSGFRRGRGEETDRTVSPTGPDGSVQPEVFGTTPGVEEGQPPRAGRAGLPAISGAPQIFGPTLPSVPARITDLANALTRQVQFQKYENIPLGFTADQFLPTRSKRFIELQLRNNVIAQQLGDTSAMSEEEIETLTEEGKAVLEEMNREQQNTTYIARPGLGPREGFVAEAVIDYSRRMQADPTKYTLDAMRFDAKMLSEMQKYAVEQEKTDLLYSNDISPTLRDLARQNKIQDLYQNLDAVMPSFNIDSVMNLNGVDDYAMGKFAEFVADAQVNDKTWEQYLEELKNDPATVDRINKLRRRSGGGTGVAIKLPSDEDLTQVFKYVSQATIGRTLPKNVYQEMINAYKPQLVQYQQQLQGGGTVTEPPQAETFAETQIEQKFGQEVFSYRLGGYLDELSKLVGGGQ